MTGIIRPISAPIRSGITLEDLFGNLTQSSESEKPEKNCTKPLLGIISLTREEIWRVVMSEHEAKIEGLARHVLKKKTLAERRRWLAEFEDKHGVGITEELKARILELAKEKRNLGATTTS